MGQPSSSFTFSSTLPCWNVPLSRIWLPPFAKSSLPATFALIAITISHPSPTVSRTAVMSCSRFSKIVSTSTVYALALPAACASSAILL